MMLLGSVIVPISPWIWLAAPVLVAAVVLMAWSYRRSPEISAVHRMAFILRLLGVLVLLLCLIEPLWSGRRVKSGENLFLVVADNSSGMNVRDQGMTRSRGEILKSTFDADRAGWLGILAENFQVREYVFDSQLRRTTDFSELLFDGKASAIGGALQTITQRYRGRPLAGVLLLTDGNATDIGEQFYDLSGSPPVYPVVVGADRPQKDISLTNVSVSQTSFEDAPVTIQADVEASGCAGKTVTLNLVESSGRVVEQQTRSISKSDEKHTFRFNVRPDRSGVLFYQLNADELSSRVGLGPPNRYGGAEPHPTNLNASQENSQDKAEKPSEATLANNKHTLVVDRGKGPYRILYVTGRPNWEYKFLRRAISEDEQIQLVGLLRVARREPKYEWLGRTGEVNNPLYRGFDNKDAEQAEQYDQPVLVRLGTRDEEELRDGFPRTAEDLFGYHAVILDDVEAGFFTHDQMELIRRFVAERGGGFLMLGGAESLREGDFNRTPIGQLLPVYLDRLPQTETVAGAKIHFNLTREGWLQPWARLRNNEQDEQQRLSTMPAFRVLNRLGAVKPGAQVVATAGDDSNGQFPALVVQRYGSGRSAALTIGDVWRWGMKQPDMRDDMNKFWRQTLRWLIADVPNRISFQAAQNRDQANQPVVFQVRVRDKAFEPINDVSIAIEVRDPNGQTVKLTGEPVLSETGLFEAVYVPRCDGSYFASVVVTDADGLGLGDAQTGWAVDLEAREFQSIRMNRPLLEKIASRTGGRVIELDGLESFARSLPDLNAPVMDTWIRPLWDLQGILPTVFNFILICFVGEWALRRWKGMP
jgi:uncharacterized membrane protein